jgi:alpha-galactosidase
LNLTNVNVQRLTVEAAITGNPEAVVWALALDPLTSAKLTLAEIREMATEMLIAEAEWLPQFKGRLPRSTPKVVEPAGTVRVDVPMDPALAISVRFGQL